MAKHKDIEIIAPRANPFFAGHALAEQRFIQEFNQGLVHHAYLMTGAKGIGKATLAYRFTRFVLGHGAMQSAPAEESFSLFGDAPPAPSPSPTTLSMAEDTPLFRRIAAGSHTDLLTLSPAYDAKKHIEKSTISVEEARQVPNFLSLTPAEGAWRVVIVDAVDQLTPNAANALLKIIEEPPPQALLFLVCHNPAAILPTIRSRCRNLKLTAPSHGEFGDILNHIAPSIAQHDYAALYALSYGSPGHAITLHVHEGLRWYEGWLAAMQPSATPETRQKFAESVGAQKAPEAWATIVHAWHMALARITLHPHYANTQPIFAREAEQLEAIANATPPLLRRAWSERGNMLIHHTETFNLDKRHTVRLLADARQLDMLAG